MKGIFRIFTSVTARLDHIADQLENHEAVAQSNLKEFQEDIRGAKVQLKILHRELKTTSNNRVEAEEKCKSWRQRARHLAENDRPKALQCMKRLKQSESDLVFWTTQHSELNRQYDSLKQQIATTEKKYNELKVKLQDYVSRDKSSQLKSKIVNQKSGSDSIGDVFERWDKVITNKEIEGDVNSEHINQDPFEAEFEQKEKNIDLEQSLDDLIKE